MAQQYYGLRRAVKGRDERERIVTVLEQTTTGRLLLTIPEAAVALGIGRTLAYELVLKGALPSVKLGRARRIPVATLQAWVERQVAELPIERTPDVAGKSRRDG